MLIDADVLAYLDLLVIMEPSHQPYNVRGARALAEAFPGLLQVACFDTSFHRTMPEIAQIYALPKDVLDEGARHWGYHGISYDYISRQIPKYAPKARRVIVAHLGGGASMCAMLEGKSIETTMGFGAVTGLPMATRSGDVPQDLLFYLLRRGLFDDASLEKMLYERSGLLGLSGISDDMRELQASNDPRAAAAIAFFVYAMTKYVGAYASVLGGLDALVFTAGIGENSAPVRAGLCRALGWLGVSLDEAANDHNGPCISTADSRVSVWVIPTNEELMIAQHTLALVSSIPASRTLAHNVVVAIWTEPIDYVRCQSRLKRQQVGVWRSMNSILTMSAFKWSGCSSKRQPWAQDRRDWVESGMAALDLWNAEADVHLMWPDGLGLTAQMSSGPLCPVLGLPSR